MEDDDSFATVLTGMQGLSAKRDPRSVRLAAVTAALLEVVGDDVSSAKVYASTVSALEGTLQQGAADSVTTQLALLELLYTTVPHVSTPTIRATLSVTSRVLRAVVTFYQAATETSEDLGAANATLRGVVRASGELIKRFHPTQPEKAVKQLFNGTILTLFEDRRPKVRKAAHNATCELLMMESCHPSVAQSVQSYSLLRLKNQNVEDAHLLHLLAFLERSVVFLDLSLGQRVMELLLEILHLDTYSSTNDFIAGMSRKDVTAKILLANSLLSTLVALLESDNDSSRRANDEFAKRVLASLLQARPMVLFGSGSCDDDLIDSGRTLYGRVLLLSCQRVFQTDSKVGCKLFPLVIQTVLQLCRPSDEAPNVEVAQTLMVELTRTFRINLHPIVELTPRPPELDQCLDDALHCIKPILHHSFRPTWSVTLQALAFLLHLVKETEQVHDVVESLVQLHTLVAADPTAREVVESAVGSLIQGVGIEAFWAWVTWKEPMGAVSKKRNSKIIDGVISPERVWLLPLMKTASMGVFPRLEFFQCTILQLARQCDAFSAAPHVDAVSASFHRARVIDLWSLFPCFCRHPTDLDATFPALSQTLVRAMGDARYPELVVRTLSCQRVCLK
jgi:ribosomal RNA-processing protein 12